MASRVNTKFVVILTGVLAVVGGSVVAVGWMTLRKGPEELAARGDAAAEAGNWVDAAEFYSRAVYKDQNNPELLRLWIGALEHIVPESPQQYVDMYFRAYLPALRSWAELGRTDAALHRRYLEEQMQRLVRFGASLSGWEEMVRASEEALRHYTEGDPAAAPVARYRGLARLGVYAMGTDLSPEHFEQAVADLEGAVRADPTDSRAAVALSELYRARAGRLRLAREDKRADADIASARAALRSFLEAQPRNVEAMIEMLRLESVEAARVAAKPPTYAELAAAHRGLLEPLVEAARTAEPGSMRPVVAATAANVVLPLEEYGRDVAVEILDRAMGDRDDAALLIEKAEIELRAGNPGASIELLQRVIDLKDLPLSLDGLALIDQRTRAAAKQIDCVLSGWKAEQPASERAAVLAEAQKYRDALAERIGTDRLELDLIDAKLKYAAGELDTARTLLSRYSERRGGNDPAALSLLGDILQRQGSMGAARSQYERATQLRPSDTRLWLALAGVDVALRDYEKAAESLRRVLQLDPGNESATEQLRVVAELQSGDGSSDPIVAAIKDVQDLTGGVNPDAPAALERLRSAIAEHGQDQRLASLLARLLAATGDRAGALEAARAGAAANPQSATLAAMVRQLSVEDPMEAALASINSMDATDLRKHLMRHELFSRAGKGEEAKAELEAARAIDPAAPAVLELDFVAAVLAKNADRAREIAQQATARNADNVNGLSFKARLSLMDEKYADAESFLRQATEIDPFNPLLWRYLGETRLVLRQNDRATEAFRKALEIRPTDLPSVKGLVRVQYTAGRAAEALATARTAAGNPTALADPEFLELWTTLESSVPGGDKAKALQTRRQLAERDPANRRNRAALVELLLATNEREEARTLIDELRAGGDDLGLVELDARWHIAGGDFQGAVDVFRKHIDGLAADQRRDTPAIVLARLLAGAGQGEAAVQLLEQSRQFQDSKEMAVDRELADFMFRAGRYEQALEGLRAILAAGAQDEDGRMLRGVVECLNRLGRYEEAETTLAGMGEAVDTDASLLLMRAQAAAGRGDRARARALFDRAIALDSKNPAGFFARAEFLARDPAQMADAVADMGEVVRLDPTFAGARRWLAQAAANAGNWEEALKQLRAEVNERPDDDEARANLINVLLSRRSTAEALELLGSVIKRRPDALNWLMASAEIHARAGVPARAVPHLERAWGLSKTPEVAVAYVLALLANSPPSTGVAAQVLATPELGVEKNLALLLTRARVRAVAGQAEPSRADLEAAYRLVDHAKQGEVGLFFNATIGLMTEPAARMRLLESLARIKPFTGWFQLNYAMVRQGVPDGLSGLDEVLAPLAAQREDANLAMTAMTVLGQVYREQKRYEQAAATFKQLLDIVPEDPNTNNNYAYVLGHDLGRAAEALPYAEKAAGLLPQSSGTLHTLGVVALGAGKLAQAETALERSLGAAVTPQEKAPVYVAIARLGLAQGDRTKAERYLGHARELLASNPGLSAAYGAELEEVTAKFEGR